MSGPADVFVLYPLGWRGSIAPVITGQAAMQVQVAAGAVSLGLKGARRAT
jgi:hypothetical protein